MEEVDLCWRLRNTGQKLAIVPASRVYHVGGGTLPKSNPFKTYLNFRNNLLLLYKNLPERGLSRRIFTRKLMDGLSAALFLVQFKFRDIAAIGRAHRDARKDLKRYRVFRQQQEALHGYPELTDIYQRSVVVDYFLLGRKTFSRLRNGYAEKMNERIIEKDG
jgi:GT2 family glycosyltransferase